MSELDILESETRFLVSLDAVLHSVDEEHHANEHGRMRPGGRVNLNDLGDNVWLRQFRFTRSEVHELVKVLELPPVIECSENRIKEDQVTALCMLLRRLAYPARLSDVELELGWERTRFSRITRATATMIWTRWKHLLRFDPARLTPEKLAEFGRVLAVKGSPTDHIVALIDGTLRRIARPVWNQRILYNGWKRVHCLKYHALLAPDGIIIHLFGPVEGIRHDETVLKESGLTELLRAHFHAPDGTPLFIYGDSGYAVGTQILSPFKGAHLTEEEVAWNSRMSKVRQAVEWIFGEVAKLFPFLDFKANQKILLTPCALFYMVAILLCNAHTILHHPQVPQYFHYNPPTLEQYFNGDAVQDDKLDEWCLSSPWHTCDANFVNGEVVAERSTSEECDDKETIIL